MRKEKFKKLMEEYKPKYIYQRYDGRIIKYEVINDNYLVDTVTGMSFDFKAHMMLGKLSDNILDLLEVGDVVTHGEETIFITAFENKDQLDYFVALYKHENLRIKSIITRQQFSSMEYKLED